MENYTWVLFDADDTLFHFDAFRGLQLMFSHYGVEFNREDYEAYELINRSLWTKYQNGTITAEQLQCERFAVWAEKLDCTSQKLNHEFMVAMAAICSPLDGAISLLNVLKARVKLGIITNGFITLQHDRLMRTGLKEHFEFIVISEEVGFAKPHQGIFEHTLRIMGQPAREQVLMVGDNPDSDIVGGLNAGLHTCWLNRHNMPTPEGIKPHYQVSSLAELEQLFTA